MRSPLTRLLDGLMDFRPVSARLIDSLDYIGDFTLEPHRVNAGRLSIPATGLAELGSYAGPLPRLAIEASARPASREDWETTLESDARTVTQFLAQRKDAEIEVYEIHAPRDLSSAQAIRDLGGFREVEVFVSTAEEDAAEFLVALAESDWLGFATSSRNWSGALGCLDLEVPFRLHGDDTSDWTQLATLAMARCHDLLPNEILERQDQAWRVTNRQIFWGDLAIDEVEIEELRALLNSMTVPDVGVFLRKADVV